MLLRFPEMHRRKKERRPFISVKKKKNHKAKKHVSGKGETQASQRHVPSDRTAATCLE